MAKGGYREGAGRKKGVATLEREKARQYISERIAEYMPAIFDVLIKKALKGDSIAIKELFDRGFGKAVQGIDISGGLNLKVGKLEEIENATREILTLPIRTNGEDQETC